MKNTGITYTSAERSPVILPEMAELLPPLSAEQSAALEEDLLRNGCYSPIIVNEDMVIVDGHNRQSLCEKHGLPYTMAVFSFEDLLEAKQWALDTQKNRRNLEKWELGKIALKLKPEIEAKARANQGTRTDLSATLPEAVWRWFMNKQTHRTCVRMSAKEYNRLMERSRAAGLSANAWLMEQLAGNRPIISRNGIMSDFLCLLNQKGREINTVARAFNSGYGTAEGLQQALDCLKDIAQAAYEVRKEGFTHAP